MLELESNLSPYTESKRCPCGCDKEPRKDRTYATGGICRKRHRQQILAARSSAPCPCGCLQPVKNGNKFATLSCVRRLYPTKPRLNAPELPCPCGCGGSVKRNNKWATSGCPRRGKPLTAEHRAKLSVSVTKTLVKPELRQARSEALKARYLDPEYKARHLAAMQKLHKDSDFQQRRGASIQRALRKPENSTQRAKESKKRWQDPEYRHTVIRSMTLAGENTELRKKRSETTKSLWANADFKSKMTQGRARGDHPSKLHLKVKLAMEEAGIHLTTHVPIGFYVVDEADPIRKIAVEINGCYWHSCPVCKFAGPGKARIDKAKRTYLANRGWTLIEIWEHEWRTEPAACISRIRLVL